MPVADYYSQENITCEAPLSMAGVVGLVVTCCLAGLVWAIRNVRKVTAIDLNHTSDINLDEADSISSNEHVASSQKQLLLELGSKISEVPLNSSRAPKSSSNRSTSSAPSSSQSCTS